MDEHAFLWANRLLGNSFDSAQLEITIGQLSLEVQQPTTIAITGGDLGASLNGKPIKPWFSYPVDSGDLIAFSTPVSGLRAYLAVKGGFDFPKQLGSVSTVSREKIGGLHSDGKKLAPGDLLNYQPSSPLPHTGVPSQFIPDYQAPITLGVILGYQCESFSKTEISKFFSLEYEVSSDIDRMGYRLSGEAVHSCLDE